MFQLRLLFLAACLSVQSQGGLAAPSGLQSGEHDGFTRLVASFAGTVTWRAEKIADTVILHLEGHDEGFDPSGVFDKITRERISSLEYDEDTLTLTLGCDCNVAVFAVGTQYVAIDVLTNGVETALPLLQEQEIASKEKETNLSAVAPEKALPEPVENSTDVMSVERLDAQGLPREALSDRELELLDDVQQQLAEEVGGAATRGILEQAGPMRLPKATWLQEETSSLDDHLQQYDALPEELPDAVRNMRISNSMDIPGSDRSDRKTLSAAGMLCPDNAEVDVGSWGGDTDFHIQIGSARARLFGEFDRLDREVALDLAQIYIHHGFGAEARQTLTLDPALAKENRVMIGLSEVLEHGEATDAAYFRSMLACKTDIALWAILAEDHLDFPGVLDPAPALLALNRLPVHLRKVLAPELSRRFLEHGDSEAATLALRSVERLPDPMSVAGRYAQAEIRLDAGERDKAKAQLEDVIEKNAAQSPQALIALVDAQMQENQPISHETAGLIEAYARELRETELGPELRRAHVLALAKSGQFDRAFAALGAIDNDQLDPDSVSLRARLLMETTESADDVVFLEHLFGLSQEKLKQLPLALNMKIAERYLALGFEHAAQEIIDVTPAAPRNRTRQLLAARVALRLERPAMTQGALLGLVGEEEDLLRAQAQRMAGAMEEAHRLYVQADRPQDAMTTAWLANDWQSLTPDETPLLGPVATVAAQTPVPDRSYVGMLARTKDALQESINARQVLSDLLSAPGLQIDGQSPAE